MKTEIDRRLIRGRIVVLCSRWSLTLSARILYAIVLGAVTKSQKAPVRPYGSAGFPIDDFREIWCWKYYYYYCYCYFFFAPQIGEYVLTGFASSLSPTFDY